MPSRSGARSPVRMAGLAGALVAAAVLLLVVAQLPGVRREISRSTSREPARFTELYFTDPGALPKRLSTSDPNGFRFTIVNHEQTTMVYAFVVTVQSPLGTQTIGQGRVRAAAGGAVVEQVQFRPSRPGVTYLVTVGLLHRSESIHFTAAS